MKFDFTYGGAFEETSVGTCQAAIGCDRPAAWVRTKDQLPCCRTCQVQLALNIRQRAERAKDESKKTTVEPLDVPPGTCGCGCGAKVQRTFKPGHNARLKAQRRKAAKE
jgi:hypothetical protein